ncbi:MAG: hypothetical protein MZV70_19295 [Desulfobacterales bacterium]|nr:hypothetical protein [Desulfobacterales bacterium]
MLLVFAFAAAVAVRLYLEIPRVAFEHQRNQEGMLVERGEQFVRAIRVYYRKNQKYRKTSTTSKRARRRATFASATRTR